MMSLKGWDYVWITLFIIATLIDTYIFKRPPSLDRWLIFGIIIVLLIIANKFDDLNKKVDDLK